MSSPHSPAPVPDPIEVAEQHPLFKTFETAYKVAARQSAFAIGGSLPVSEIGDGKMCLYVPVSGNGHDKVYRPYHLPLDKVSSEALYDAGSPSPHGRGGETVYDATYRDAREIKPPGFGISMDIFPVTGLLHHIAAELGTGPLLAKLNKLNMYAKGGFFKTHKDTPLGTRHIGSIVLCLPSPFSGGELVIENGDQQVTFDFAKTLAESPNTIAWAFLYSDCEHEVLPVASGVRIALAYDVYVSDEIGGLHLDAVDTRSKSIKEALDSFLTARIEAGLLPKGGLIGIGLEHEYPMEQGESSSQYKARLPSVLKGVDRGVFDAVTSSGLRWDFNAIFREDDCWEGFHLVLMNGFLDLKDEYLGECSIYDVGGKPTDDILWLVGPQTFHIENIHMTYGNEAQTAYAYAAAVVILAVPPISS